MYLSTQQKFKKISSLLFFTFCISNVSTQANAESTPTQVNLQLEQALYSQVKQERILDALVEAVNKATITAQTSGRVSKIYFDVNDYVKKGSVLLRMRDKDQQAKLNAATAKFKQAETEFNRVQELYLKKLMSKSGVDRAESQYKSTKAKFDQAQENVERTIIRAPYSGIVVKRHIEVGETARPGVPLFTGLSLETLRVVVNLPQDMINIVRQNKQARVLLLNDDNINIKAKSMTFSPYADADSHTFLVRVNLPDGDHGLYPGMAVKVAFTTGEENKLQVPASAVTHRSEVTAVYVMHKDILSMRQIRAGHTLGENKIEVLSGLLENEMVAIDPVKAAGYLKDQKQTGLK